MTSARLQDRLNPDPLLPRDRLVLDVLPYGLLVFCVLLMLSSWPQSGNQAEVAGLVLSGLSGAWMLVMYTLHPAWRQRPRVMAVFITVLLVLGALLILDNTIYGIYTFSIYFFVIRYLVWPWRLLGAAAVAFTWSRWLNIRAFGELSEAQAEKHAANGHAHIARVGGVTGLVGLPVADRLRHPPAGKPEDGGFGLVAMRQRIERLAGTLQVESEPGVGTGISACLPVASAQARS